MNQREIQRLLKTNFAYSKILLLTHENKNMCKYAHKLLRRVGLCYLDTKKLFPFSNGQKNHKHTVCYILSGHQQIKEGQMLTVSEFKKMNILTRRLPGVMKNHWKCFFSPIFFSPKQ